MSADASFSLFLYFAFCFLCVMIGLGFEQEDWTRVKKADWMCPRVKWQGAQVLGSINGQWKRKMQYQSFLLSHCLLTGVTTWLHA